MATKETKKEKTFDNNRKNQKHLAKNFDKALAMARETERAEVAATVEKYLVMAAHGSETNWKPVAEQPKTPTEPTEPEAPAVGPSLPTAPEVTLPVEEIDTEQPAA